MIMHRHNRFKTPWPARGLACWIAVLLAACASMQAGPAAAADAASDRKSPTASSGSGGNDPCDDLLSVLDRPSMADSPCAVKPWHVLAEQGYLAGPVKGSDFSHLSMFPQSEVRFGLPYQSELKVLAPNYMIGTQPGGGHTYGFGDTSVGALHQFATFNDFVVSADARLTLPTGRKEFSDGGVEANVQGIIGYNITPKLGITGLIGVSTLTSRQDDGRVVRFTSFNPDVVVSYKLTDSFQIYSEVYGNTTAGPHQGGNVSYQGGVQYLVTKSIEVDVSAGTLLRGPSDMPSRYISFGGGVQF